MVLIRVILSILIRRIMSHIKEMMWRRIWNNSSPDQTSYFWKEGENGSTLLDPKAIFVYQIEDDERPFTIYHFISHMENMRAKLPQRDYDMHRDWIYSKYPNHVPTFKQLALALLQSFIRCCSKVFV